MSRRGTLVPVLAGSAGKNIGVQTLLDAIDRIPAVSPLSAPEPADATAAPVAFVFKTIVDPQKGTYSMFRVYQRHTQVR